VSSKIQWPCFGYVVHTYNTSTLHIVDTFFSTFYVSEDMSLSLNILTNTTYTGWVEKETRVTNCIFGFVAQ